MRPILFSFHKLSQPPSAKNYSLAKLTLPSTNAFASFILCRSPLNHSITIFLGPDFSILPLNSQNAVQSGAHGTLETSKISVPKKLFRILVQALFIIETKAESE